jgi:hypothetical protein
VAKDKKKKKGKKADKGGASKVVKNLQALSQNPMVADLVAATLVGAAAALKDSNRARKLATDASDELQALGKKGAERGNAMWQLALEVGRRALNEIAGEKAPKRSAKPRKPTSAKAAKPPSKRSGAATPGRKAQHPAAKPAR